MTWVEKTRILYRLIGREGLRQLAAHPRPEQRVVVSARDPLPGDVVDGS